ncbi:MAG: glycosyltransferase [Flavobacteriaceae bacterium]|nr:glycosyltransferase [Flavobacteriaceae bacterium]
MAPKVSIITINYNNAKGLEQTIASVLSQTYKNFEFILIDGASNDGSVELIEANRDKFTYCISEKDTGIYNAMNKGIRVSSGQYLLFLNSGDLLTQASALHDFIHHEKFVGDIIYGDYKFKEGAKVYADQLSPIYFMRTSLPHQSTFFKKEVFEQMGLYDETYSMGGDRAYFIKCFMSEQFKFTHVNYFLTYFDLEGLSNSKEHRKRKNEEDERMFREYFGVHYEDYKKQLELEQELKQTKKRTVEGIAKRIKHKIQKLWKHRRW